MSQPVALQNPSRQTAFSLRHSNHSNYSIGSIAIIGLLWGAIYLAGMFAPALLDDADTVHAEAAREMVLRHDWVTLYANGVRYLEKAPLMYWGVAASFRLFGVAEWSARLPLVIGVLALLIAVYFLGKRIYGERA